MKGYDILTRGVPRYQGKHSRWLKRQRCNKHSASQHALRNTQQTTRECRAQLGSCEMAGAKARARSPERRRNGGGRCHKKRRRSLS